MKSPFWDWLNCRLFPLIIVTCVANIAATFIWNELTWIPFGVLGAQWLIIFFVNWTRRWHLFPKRCKVPWWDAEWYMQPKMTWKRMRAIQKWNREEKARANEFFDQMWSKGEKKR